MPLYEYECHDCGKHYERIEKVSAFHDGVCPACGGAARRLLGAPALKFKGSGWYVTDYGKGNGSRPATGEKHAETASETTNETSTPPPAKTEKTESKESAPTTSSKVA